ncbi:MAG: hypothetical protein SFU53_02055 [Terrimicrobiaceae bacterium]|nr:hypothetical protein [Terrimicrobiaceae bacterium]
MRDDDDFSPEEVWDEYDWERFLQQQDRNTEKYFSLLEKYMDHPNRDELIANEMGWDESADEPEFEEVAGLLCEQEDAPDEEEDNTFDEFARSPIYKDTLRLHRWINSWIEQNEALRENPDAIELASRSAVCGAKLAAALCGDESAELGMTIAYLKRGLKAANDALNAASRLAAAGHLTGRQPATVRRMIFRIRDRVVTLMSDYRAEWRKRHG